MDIPENIIHQIPIDLGIADAFFQFQHVLIEIFDDFQRLFDKNLSQFINILLIHHAGCVRTFRADGSQRSLLLTDGVFDDLNQPI